MLSFILQKSYAQPLLQHRLFHVTGTFESSLSVLAVLVQYSSSKVVPINQKCSYASFKFSQTAETNTYYKPFVVIQIFKGMPFIRSSLF